MQKWRKSVSVTGRPREKYFSKSFFFVILVPLFAFTLGPPICVSIAEEEVSQHSDASD